MQNSEQRAVEEANQRARRYYEAEASSMNQRVMAQFQGQIDDLSRQLQDLQTECEQLRALVASQISSIPGGGSAAALAAPLPEVARQLSGRLRRTKPQLESPQPQGPVTQCPVTC